LVDLVLHFSLGGERDYARENPRMRPSLVTLETRIRTARLRIRFQERFPRTLRSHEGR